MAADGFHRVQRFSTDWHANTFAGSTVRKITRAIWALDLFNDTVLVALFPAFVMLTGSTLLMGYFWPLMGVVIAVGSVLFIGLAVTLSLGYRRASRELGNAWDTKLGGRWRTP
jgi:ATP-binding cassette subfamily B protein